MNQVLPSLKWRRGAPLMLAVTLFSIATASAARKAAPDAPVIDEQPIGRKVTVGGHVALSVLAHGTPPLTFQWRKGELALTNDARITGATGAVLNIDPVFLPEASNYTVVISNAGGGSITSAPVSLVVSQIVIPIPVPVGTGALFTLIGQIGDVYRAELNINFAGYRTNGYVTNYTGVARYLDDGVGGGFRQFRAAVDHLRPVLSVSNAAPAPTLRAYGKLNQVWRIQGTTNFVHWDTLATVTNTNGWMKFTDPTVPLPPRRFYRITPP